MKEIFKINDITEVKKVLNTMQADLECMCINIHNMASLFKAMHYGIAEGALSEEESDECMCAFQSLLDSVLSDSEAFYGMNINFPSEVM